MWYSLRLSGTCVLSGSFLSCEFFSYSLLFVRSLQVLLDTAPLALGFVIGFKSVSLFEQYFTAKYIRVSCAPERTWDFFFFSQKFGIQTVTLGIILGYWFGGSNDVLCLRIGALLLLQKWNRDSLP